ncbi:S24 family peptidase [Flaviaesturariibacter amylovorans]|uniref:Peptidase S24/S26A/S26B/S26C domain-containing protein n=1 Tax=Flaviaesturariibacter amylovorans TaxID=1084520 RepID=A0ABP8GQE1_9BACT
MSQSEENSIGERLLEVLAVLKRNRKLKNDMDLAELAGYRTASAITEMKKGRMEVSEKLLDALQKNFAVNPDYILLGEGSIFSNEEQPASFIEARRNASVNKDPSMVPFVPIKAQAGYIRAYDQTVFVDTMEKYALPPGVNPHGAVWRYWEIEGESMEPAFYKGDIILTSQVHQMDWENLRNFYLYVIVTEDKVMLKRVFCKTAFEWVLISENEEQFPQQLITIDKVKEVWVFRRSILSNAKPTKVFEIKV